MGWQKQVTEICALTKKVYETVNSETVHRERFAQDSKEIHQSALEVFDCYSSKARDEVT